MNKYELIPWAEAQNLYQFSTKTNRGSIPGNYFVDKLVAIYSDGLELDVLEYKGTHYRHFEDRNIIGMIIDGDLKVAQYADLRTSDTGMGSHILVKGSFFAENLLISGMSELWVENDIAISDFILAQDQGVGLTCNGKLSVKYAFVQDFNFRIKGSLEGILYVDDNRTEVDLPESEEEKIIWVQNISDVHCIYSDELDDIEDNEDIDDDEFERLIYKYTIFERNYLLNGDILTHIQNGEKVFRNINTIGN